MAIRRVLIADDHPLSREGLALAMRAAVPGVPVDQAGTVAEAEAVIRQKRDVGLLLLDFILPDARGFSGFMRLQQLLGLAPILLVSARQDAVLVDAARALGAAGFLPKSQPLDDIAAAIRRVAEGQPVFPPAAPAPTEAARARARLADLSPAQMRVLLALADGRLNKQIAADLDVTEATVKAHMTAIFRKLGVTNRTQALLLMQPLLGDAGA